jgi:ribonuclease HII
MYRRCGFRYEKKLRALGVVRIAGIDEAGRGALAGPVVAAAVILPEKFRHRKLKDSKQLLPELRQKIYDELVARGDTIWSIGVVDSVEIDTINILRATHKAMRLALGAIGAWPDHVLIDGLPVSPFPLPQTAIIDGDCISLSIAAASVIAKVTRDRLMCEFCARFPEYCFSQHKGYGTELHLTKLHEHGPCPIHRRSFEPVAQPLLALELVRCRRQDSAEIEIAAGVDDGAATMSESSKFQAPNPKEAPSSNTQKELVTSLA